MIPSDHFVRAYNEIFKYLDQRGLLQSYFDDISRYAASRNLAKFKAGGIQAVYDYYLVIRKEENCELEMHLQDGELAKNMTRCPSLSKVLDNDATPCPKYCLHCPGWTHPVYAAAGIYAVYDLREPDQPHCRSWLYEDIERARAKCRELRQTIPAERIRINFTMPEDGQDK